MSIFKPSKEEAREENDHTQEREFFRYATSPQRLILSFNSRMDNEKIKSLFSNSKVIEEVSFMRNNIGPEEAKTIGSFLKNNGSLIRLTVSYNNMGYQGVKNLLSEVKKSLKHLNISDNNIGPEGVKNVALFLENNSSLLSLNIADNKLGPEGAKNVALFLENNSSLLSLNIAANKLGSEGAKNLSEGLKNNFSLTHLNITHNDIDNSGFEDLFPALKRNFSLTNIKFYSGNPAGIWDTEEQLGITRIIDRNTMYKMYSLNFIQHNLVEKDNIKFDILSKDVIRNLKIFQLIPQHKLFLEVRNDKIECIENANIYIKNNFLEISAICKNHHACSDKKLPETFSLLSQEIINHIVSFLGSKSLWYISNKQNSYKEIDTKQDNIITQFFNFFSDNATTNDDVSQLAEQSNNDHDGACIIY